MLARRREPFWGTNAKPFFIQSAIALAMGFGAYALGVWDFLFDLSCRYITGSCL